jgi:hypothetical protein
MRREKNPDWIRGKMKDNLDNSHVTDDQLLGKVEINKTRTYFTIKLMKSQMYAPDEKRKVLAFDDRMRER